ncbi:putative tyrosine-protein kinase Wsck [Armadillidium vulgare]|nr:putative tyrosine-protein kinase Wsck [Armadillidium vulgare]
MYLIVCNLAFLLFKIINAQNAIKVGCYSHKDIPDFNPVTQADNKLTVLSCVSNCRNVSKRFAAVKNGDLCLCGEYYSGIETDDCNILCAGNQNETCGGVSSVNLYETAGGALGAPTSLTLIENFEDTLHVKWTPPAKDLSALHEYRVKVTPTFYFTQKLQPSDKSYKYSRLTQSAYLDGLHPGVRYKVEVRAYSDKGEGYPAYLDAWTKVGKPDEPSVPKIVSQTSFSITVELEEAVPSGGPISFYRIVVVDESLHVIIDYDSLFDYHTASSKGIPYYITAQFPESEFETLFQVGDGKYYGNYYNSPLKSGRDYHVILGIGSKINETKISYSQSSHSQHENSQIHYFDQNKYSLGSNRENIDFSVEPNSQLVLGLSIAVGLFAFLLIASILIYFALKVHFKQNLSRRCGDHQELAVHAQNPNQDYENGYVVGAHYLDNEESSPDQYRLLREKVTVIPHHSINIVGEIGIGKFGDVKKGVSLNSGSEQMNSLVHRIQDDALSLQRKREMLKDFDIHIKIGKHPNVVSLLGLLEELSIISVVFEYETLSLKSNLVESRAVQHYPVYAEKNRRFSTVQENQILEILIGVTRGMKHLHSLNIAHGQLSARNIALRDGIRPKISGFGLLDYHNDIYISDYRRWQAPEILQSKRTSSCKSDLWSFGCLMWEAVTLGGTPYADVRTEELAPRIVPRTASRSASIRER